MKLRIYLIVAAGLLCTLLISPLAFAVTCPKAQYADMCDGDRRFYGAHACSGDESKCCYYMQDCPYGCLVGQCKSRPAAVATTVQREKAGYPKWVYVKDCMPTQGAAQASRISRLEGVMWYLPYLLVGVFLVLVIFAYRKKKRRI